MEDRQKFLFFLVIKLAFGRELKMELPLCPTNIDFLPQTLPMHCRLPRSANFASYPDGSDRPPTLPPYLAPFYQSPPPSKIPFQLPPGFSGYPGIPMPASAQVIAGSLPGPIPVPMPTGMQAPIGPLPIGGPAHKLPVIVMPFYAPDKSYQRHPQRPPQKHYSDDSDTDQSSNGSCDTDSSSDTECSGHDSQRDSDRDRDRNRDSGHDSDQGWWKSKKGFRRSGKKHSSHRHRAHRLRKKWPREIVTPVLQYVNNNGYVIFEKKISKGEAKEWLSSDNNLIYKNEKKDDDDNEEKEMVANDDEGEKTEKYKSKSHPPELQPQVNEEKTSRSSLEIEPVQSSKKHHKHQKESEPVTDESQPKPNAKESE